MNKKMSGKKFKEKLTRTYIGKEKMKKKEKESMDESLVKFPIRYPKTYWTFFVLLVGCGLVIFIYSIIDIFVWKNEAHYFNIVPIVGGCFFISIFILMLFVELFRREELL